jgi:hypothetical protein
MDIAGFLLATGFALLVLLLGWSSQIISKSKETRELESEFLKKANLKDETYKKIIRESGSDKDSLFALVDFLYSREDTGDIEIFENIKTIKGLLTKLDKKYSNRFWILLFMSVTFLVTGIIAIFLPLECKYWTIVPNLLFTVTIFENLISVFSMEKKYINSISKIIGKL